MKLLYLSIVLSFTCSYYSYTLAYSESSLAAPDIRSFNCSCIYCMLVAVLGYTICNDVFDTDIINFCNSNSLTSE